MVRFQRTGEYPRCSCVICNKTQEIWQKSKEKVWFHDFWQQMKQEDGSLVWDREFDVWRVGFRLR
jgi:hypothetical protein